MKIKTKKIIFRVELPLYEFITSFSQATGMNKSELIRNVLVYFHMGYLMGEFKKPFAELKEDFLKSVSTERKKQEVLKKFKPEKFKRDLLQV
jgi:hypothetical protein